MYVLTRASSSTTGWVKDRRHVEDERRGQLIVTFHQTSGDEKNDLKVLELRCK